VRACRLVGSINRFTQPPLGVHRRLVAPCHVLPKFRYKFRSRSLVVAALLVQRMYGSIALVRLLQQIIDLAPQVRLHRVLVVRQISALPLHTLQPRPEVVAILRGGGSECVSSLDVVLGLRLKGKQALLSLLHYF